MFNTVVLLIGYAVSVFVGGVFVDWALGHVLGEEDRAVVAGFEGRGLEHGPRVIGWLERFLITTFVLAGSHAAVGLVLASKAVIRYPEIKDARNQKIAEYVLIETMLSLTWALLVSVLVLNFTA
jgi:hypothetical protein